MIIPMMKIMMMTGDDCDEMEDTWHWIILVAIMIYHWVSM